MSDATKFFGGIAVFIVFMMWLAAALDRAACEARWSDSGRRYEWGVMSGCRVEDKDGRLIPADVIREVR